MLNIALSRVHSLMESKGCHIIHTSEISRADRELLMRHHWLEEIIRGWYLTVRPDLLPGDSTAWYANFWDFVRVYLKHHYEKNYCLSAECSLDIHLGSSNIPKQVIVIATSGSGTPLQLPYETSLLVYADPIRLSEEREEIRGLQVMSLEYALCKVSPTYFQTSPQDAEVALRSITNLNELLRVIVQYNFKSAAGRLVGAYRFLGDFKTANNLKTGLEEIGISINEKNPFVQEAPLLSGGRFKSPYVARIHVMWEQFRSVVIDHFPSPPGLAKNANAYLKKVSEIYAQDAYNSLSIEGYQVSKELIEKVKRAEWHPDQDLAAKQQRDALAARGYYEAFLSVKESVAKVLKEETPGKVAAHDLSHWYQKLFTPSVNAGILAASDLFGYRRHQVYIRHSRHTPPAREYLIDTMEALFDLLALEEHAGVRAVLGHFIFVYIHPYMDGNGRVGRFLMNVMLASGGYPWTVISADQRSQYLLSLEAASVGSNILPFTQFIAHEMSATH